MIDNTKTHLSNKIFYFIKKTGEKLDSYGQIEYISDNFQINWSEIDTLFIDCRDDFIYEDDFENWFEYKLRIFQQIMCQCTKLLENNNEFELLLKNNSLWTNRTNEIMYCYRLYQNEDNFLEILLHLTSIYERSLGDLFSTKNQNVPFLLRDLLKSDELNSLLGRGPIKLLQILIGTPKALNLRNLAWHGFFSRNELKNNHLSIFFIILVNIQNILIQQGILLEQIPHRPLINNFDEFMNKIDVNKFNMLNISDIEFFINNTDLIGESHIIYWRNVLKYTQENKNMNSVTLFLPLFEQVLRNVFCQINSCPDRILTAVTNEFYTTLDEIFADYVHDAAGSARENKLLHTFNLGAIECYQDLFSNLYGPRLRDKLSHGEMNMDNCPQSIMIILYHLTLYFIMEMNVLQNKTHKGQLSLNEYIIKTFDTYRSISHPNAVLRSNILETYEKFNEFNAGPTQDEVTFEIKLPDDTKFNEILKICGEKFEKSRTYCVNDFKDLIRTTRAPTIFRPDEEKFIKKLNKTLRVLINILQQITDYASTRFNLYKNHELTSRQRNNFESRLPIIHFLKMGLKEVLHVTTLLTFRQFKKLNSPLENDKKLHRYPQFMVNYVEDVLRLTNDKNNKWHKTAQLTQNYENKTLWFLRNI